MCLLVYIMVPKAAGPGPSHFLQSLLKTDFAVSQACGCQSHSLLTRLPDLGVGHWGEDGQTVLVRLADWQTSLWRAVGWYELEANRVSSHILQLLTLLCAPLAHSLKPPGEGGLRVSKVQAWHRSLELSRCCHPAHLCWIKPSNLLDLCRVSMNSFFFSGCEMDDTVGLTTKKGYQPPPPSSCARSRCVPSHEAAEAHSACFMREGLRGWG